MHAPSAVSVCTVRDREGAGGVEGKGGISIPTMYSHSGKAYRSREMDSMSGYHT